MLKKIGTTFSDRRGYFLSLIAIYLIFLVTIIYFNHRSYVQGQIEIGASIRDFAGNIYGMLDVYYIWFIILIPISICYSNLQFVKGLYSFIRKDRKYIHKYNRKVTYILASSTSIMSMIIFSVYIMIFEGRVDPYLAIKSLLFVFILSTESMYMLSWMQLKYRNKFVPYVFVVSLGFFLDLIPNILLILFKIKDDVATYIVVILILLILEYVEEKKSMKVEYI